MAKDFVKIYPGFFLGTMVRETAETRLCFLAMLLLSDSTGIVRITKDALARYANVPLDTAATAIERLSAPDPDSTSPDQEGRRIVPWGEGANTWRLVNHRLYLNKSKEEDRKDYKREWDRAHATERHVSGSKRENPTKPDKPDPKEKKRKEKKKKEKEEAGLPLVVRLLGFEGLLPLSEKYERHRKENGWKQIERTSAESRAKSWSAYSEAQIGAAIQRSIDNGWRGVFPDKEVTGGQVKGYERV